MPKYFIDTEFHEYHKQVKVAGIKVGKPIPTIDLISIGIVSEVYESRSKYSDELHSSTSTLHPSKEYYVVCKDFNLEDAWNANQGTKENPNYWLRENVLKPIHLEMSSWDGRTGYNDIKDFKRLLNKYGKTKKQIATEIQRFVYNPSLDLDDGMQGLDVYVEEWLKNNDIKFYAYYADYDWVVFAQLFGSMMELPKGFPYYCIDLKQILDEKYLFSSHTPDCDPNYPKQENEHNALADAMWNKQLYNFLNNL